MCLVRFSFSMGKGWIYLQLVYEDELNEKRDVCYTIRVKKGWFRGKTVFPDRLFTYERQLKEVPSVILPLNAGNMIYVMMRRLVAGVDWEKQDLLIASYRNLMYRMSYVTVTLLDSDRDCLTISGQKDDVLWSLSFMTQAFPEDPIHCQIQGSDGSKGTAFSVRDGSYEGKTAVTMQSSEHRLPDIWSFGASVRERDLTAASEAVSGLEYSETPGVSGQPFGLPDGRQCTYLRMDERFAYADTYGYEIAPLVRHQISASLLKDFEDLVRKQASMDYELYHIRYQALMNKVHELEKRMGGLEISCYDALPIGERGLPYASDHTLARTNELECNSLKYLIEKVSNHKRVMNARLEKAYVREAGFCVIHRIQGYDLEYQSYQLTDTSQGVCDSLRMAACCMLYADFAQLDAIGVLGFPPSVYRVLCNDPVHNSYQLTEWERQKSKLFGRGYADFLYCQLEGDLDARQRRIYEKAWKRLQDRYLKKS